MRRFTFAYLDDELAQVPHLSVDGIAPLGPNVSHWPGNRTPAPLRHDLSTGACLRLAARAREGISDLEGAFEPWVSNNHYDTDGALSLFAVLHPEIAQRHEALLLETASTGDFRAFVSSTALALDLLITAFVDPERSPIASEFRDADAHERERLAYLAVLARLPEWLEHGPAHPELWQAQVEKAHEDLAYLRAQAHRVIQDDALELQSLEIERDVCDHAWHGVLGADRTLRVERTPEGSRYELTYSTKSWFDLASRRPLPRVELSGLAARLNEEERPDEFRWHADPVTNPTSRLWFGRADAPPWADRSAYREASALEPARVVEYVRELLDGQGLRGD